MKISTIGEFEVLIKVDQSVANMLSDLTISRRVVVDLLHDKNIEVSEKLVRTYRDNLKKNYSTLREVLEEKIKATEPEQQTRIVFSDTVYEGPTTQTGKWEIKPGKAKSGKTIVVMPDVQAPLHDVVLVDKFIHFLADYDPDELAQVGDFTDSTEISRWVRGKKEEYAGDLQAGFDASRQILADIRTVFDGRFRIVRSNHDDRLEAYLYGCAPGLNLRDLRLERQVGFDEYGVEFVRDSVIELVKDTLVMAHGDEGSLSPQAGKTAFGLAKNKFGVSVICGHTHRAGITSESYGYNGEVKRVLTGMEVGHFMDMKQAHYLAKRGGAANWQQAFGIVDVIHGKTFYRPVYVNDGEFSVDGELY